MNKVKSWLPTVAGGTFASFPLIASVCGVGCVGVCGAAAAGPLASVFGLSGIMALGWLEEVRPLLLGLSVLFFTVGFFKIYSKPTKCEGPTCKSHSSKSNQGVKIFFWAAVLLSAWLYVSPLLGQIGSEKVAASCSHTVDGASAPGCIKSSKSSCSSK